MKIMICFRNTKLYLQEFIKKSENIISSGALIGLAIEKRLLVESLGGGIGWL